MSILLDSAEWLLMITGSPGVDDRNTLEVRSSVSFIGLRYTVVWREGSSPGISP